MRSLLTTVAIVLAFMPSSVVSDNQTTSQWEDTLPTNESIVVAKPEVMTSGDLCSKNAIINYMSACFLTSLDKWSINVTIVSAVTGIEVLCDPTLHSDCTVRMCCVLGDVIDCKSRLTTYICGQQLDQVMSRLRQQWPQNCSVVTQDTPDGCQAVDSMLKTSGGHDDGDHQKPIVRTFSDNRQEKINIYLGFNAVGHTRIASVAIVWSLIFFILLIIY